MKKLSIIMPFLNEEREPINTVQSMCATADPNRFEVVAIDDCSTKKINFSNFPNVKHIVNKERQGVDWCRQRGVELAQNNYILIIDAHMRFKKDDWLNKMIKRIDESPKTLWCCVCLGLGYGNMDVNAPQGKYHGADMLFVDKDADPNRPARECIEPKWLSEKEGDEYEVPCILGANYFFSKEWFMYIRGLEGFKMWGTSEPFLSLKSYMAGGNCRLTKDIEIGHVFRSNAPYRTEISALVYNKIFLCKTLLPKDIGEKLIGYLPNDLNFRKAMEQIDKDSSKIEKDWEYYNDIFNFSIYDYCSKFNINLP